MACTWTARGRESLPRVFQEEILRLKEALGPLLQSKDCKPQGQASSADGDVAGKRGWPVSRVGTAQLQPKGAVREGQDFQFSMRNCKSGLTFLEFSMLGKSTNI